MRYIIDWHIHSKYSRACSKELELPNIAAWCARKGIDIVATGDWTHPAWFAHLKEWLVESEPGIYQLKSDVRDADLRPVRTRFMLVQEVSQIYKKGDKTRRIHNLIFSPSLETCQKVINALNHRGYNLKSDGRPILGIDSEELYKLLKTIDERIMIIPAHAWTPWYAIFGSKSGFDFIEECFGEMSPYIYAIETGLSSDPLMNWGLSQLDSVVCVSNSDAHSPRNLGREANVMEIEHLSYDECVRILKEQDKKCFLYTIEFHPEEGKYHFDGCAACHFSCSQKESKKQGLCCPSCRKPLTLGVEHRVKELADRDGSLVKDRKIPYKSIVPLAEIIAECLEVKSTLSKRVEEIYFHLTDKVANEFTLLLDTPLEVIRAQTNYPLIPEAIDRMRRGHISVSPGYDGIYGIVNIFPKKERPKSSEQKTLF